MITITELIDIASREGLDFDLRSLAQKELRRRIEADQPKPAEADEDPAA